MKKWMAIIAALALAVAATAAIVVAVGGDGGGADDPCDPLPLRSDCGVDPNECNQVHNIDACDDGALGVPANDEEPVGEESDSGGGTTVDDPCDPLPLRSDCGIDPDECNLVHNINACTEEELEQGFPNMP